MNERVLGLCGASPGLKMGSGDRKLEIFFDGLESSEALVAVALSELQDLTGLTDLELLRATSVWMATVLGYLGRLPADGGLG